ncbi:M4 family metallopeptidase [Hazenella sp. IB182357]|uniref:Neutral metalloproteinase n=1 Tax=Polycladospora coralii TaxID=2771432 RepID=A0A926NCA6_9BACL|nr:M4 family metallopeptidase [Polycladospora coralii]MBD1372755.1 M4 family metallopeptidase [Polycladospora coralii]MBS7531147.1 M4 family metallopeptidase [Polycladospora coralii]
MKWGKIFSVVVATALVAPLASPTALAVDNAKSKQHKQNQKASKISHNSKGKDKISWDKENGVPSFISGEISSKKVKGSKEAKDVIKENEDLFQIDEVSSELKLIEESNKRTGGKKFIYQQVYNDIPVFGHKLILHTDKAGKTTSINGDFNPKVKGKKLNTKAKYSAKQAIQKGKEVLGVANAKEFLIEEAAPYIYKDLKGKYHFVHAVTLSTLEGGPKYFDIFIDARNLKVVDKIDKTMGAHAEGSGVDLHGKTVKVNAFESSGTFYLYDTTKPMYTGNSGVIATYTANQTGNVPGTLLTDSNNYWTHNAAVSAHVNSGIVYDYYYNKFGRNSYDGVGGNMISSVNFSDPYCPDNAFWLGTQMAYCDAGNMIATPAALDVVGHEITHGVIDRTADLFYYGESGALNESWSDVMGNLIENKSDNNWLLGEDLGRAFRSMSNPTAYGHPAHMDDFLETTADKGGVHSNSSIPNKAFYNFVTSSGVTRDEAANVWYDALTDGYLTEYSTFVDAVNGTIAAAEQRFGSNSTEVRALTNAWASVGLSGNGSVGTSGDSFESNDTIGAAYGPITSGKTYNGTIHTGSDVDWFKFTKNNSGSLSITLSSLPDDYDLYLYNSSGTQLRISDNGSTNSESISYSSLASGTYYIAVVGYDGANSSQSYALKATF